MMTYKTIFSGRFEFGNPRSYEKVLKMYQHRAENYYKSEVLLNEEEIFVEDSISLSIPRFITYASDKTLRNTLNLLEYVAQYAVAGDLSVWMTDNGKILKHKVIEPNSDKVAVQAFIQGRELIQESGKENEAKEALSRAIEKFERHALAYERRGYVNYTLRNFKDAIYDYTKSIDINPSKADPYLGRAYVKIIQEDFVAAIADLEMAIKRSIPLQPIYWQARRVKADCHIKLKQYKPASLDLKLFSNRRFTSDNPNYKYRRKVLFTYGKTLMQLEAYGEAQAAFDQALTIPEGKEKVTDAELFLNRGLALKHLGKSGFVKDWKEAANQGSKRAAKLLEDITT